MTSPSPSLKAIPRVRELPLIGSLRAFQKDRLEFFLRVSRECPDIGVFHLARTPVLFPTSTRMVQAVMVTHAEDFQGGINDALTPLLGSYSLLTLFGDQHRQQRKLIAPSFTPRTVATFAPIMADYAAQAAAQWADGSLISIPQQMTFLTMRIIGKVVFGVDFNIESRDLAEAIQTGIEYVDYLMSSPVPLPLSWPTPRNRRTREALALIRGRIQSMIDERRRLNEEHKDVLSLLLAYRDENGQGLTDEQLRDQIVTLFVAGHETVTLTLSWTWNLLLEHPDVYTAMQEEVARVLEGRLPTAEDLPRLTYTLQVLKESMRLYPTSYLMARSPREDVVIEGYKLPKGALILLSSYVLHRSEELFPQADKFIPERFTPDNEKPRPRYNYIPFGAGPKTCVGNHFAMQEAHLLLAVLGQRLRFERLPGHQVRAIPGPSLRLTDFKVRVHHKQARAQQAPIAAAG